MAIAVIDRTPEIDFSVPPAEEHPTAHTVLVAFTSALDRSLACTDEDPGVYALALMALTVVEQRDTEREVGRRALDLVAKLTTQLSRTTDQNRSLQARLRDALDQINRLN